jgi:hypothetical protein
LTVTDQFVSQNNVNFHGQYSGGTTLANHTVTLIGPGGWTTKAVTDCHGCWQVTVPINANQFGTITACSDDPGANHPQVTLNAPTAPRITNFQAIAEPFGMWEFKGIVTNTPNPYGLTIGFGGMPALVGKTAKVASDGTFDVCFQMNNECGTAMAGTMDWWNHPSGPAYAAVG